MIDDRTKVRRQRVEMTKTKPKQRPPSQTIKRIPLIPHCSTNHMKSRLVLTISAAAALTGISSAQITAHSNPLGFTTQKLAANQQNLVGINLMTPVIASGSFTAVSGATISDGNANFSQTIATGKMAVLEIESDIHFTVRVPGLTAQKFVEQERMMLIDQIFATFNNRSIKFSIIVDATEKEDVPIHMRLNSKQKFERISEQYPLLKELKEKLKLEIDY